VVPAEDAVPMARARIELEHAIGAYQRAAAFDCDVVSDHTVGGPVVSALFPDVAVVATNHNAFTRSANAIYGAVADRVGVVAISRAHAATTSVPIAAVIHHGIDVDDFPLGDGDGAYVAMLTRMTPDKGVVEGIVAARRAGVELRIAAKMSDGREHRYFDEQVEPLLGDGVEYIGEVDAAGKRELLAGATALLNPIQWDEPFGMAMVEALACGTPVVSRRRGAAAEIVRAGIDGFLCDTDDELPGAIAGVAGIDRLACRSGVEERFSVVRMVEGYVDVYQLRIDGTWVR
jgi:glycosyltransferase involved in cell wall biosynthesis